MPKPKLLLRFDTEDYITRESNEALLAVLKILEKLNLKATFVLTGQKIQMLADTGETAILDYLQHHALGYHSYMHSFHPLASEYLQGMSFGEGVEQFLKVEEQGYKIFVEIFDQPPICYTQPGGDWVPHTFIALQQWEIPFFFTDSKYTLINLQEEPFMLNGILTLAKTPTATDMTSLASNPSTLEMLHSRFAIDYETAQDQELGIIFLVCHIDRFIAGGTKPWDVVNFSGGENLPRTSWQAPFLKKPQDYHRDLTAFKNLLLELKENYTTDWITAQDLVDIYQNRVIHKDRVINPWAKHTSPTKPVQMVDLKGIQQIATSFTQEISYLRIGDTWLSPIQAVFILCQALLTREKEGYFPTTIPLPNEIFFPEDIFEVTVTKNLGRLGWTELVTGAQEINTQIKTHASFPITIKVGGNSWVDLETFAGGIAQAILTMSIDGIEQDRVLLPKNRLQTKDYVKKIDQVAWSWPIFKFGFSNQEILQYTELLSWTLKPIFANCRSILNPVVVKEKANNKEIQAFSPVTTLHS